MRYKVILFDIDGTLLRAGGAGRTALARSLRDLHGIEEAHTNIQFGGRTDLSIARELFQIHGLPWNHLRAWDFLKQLRTTAQKQKEGGLASFDDLMGPEIQFLELFLMRVAAAFDYMKTAVLELHRRGQLHEKDLIVLDPTGD